MACVGRLESRPAIRRSYFDHNATTPVSRAALDAFTEAALEVYGNASSVHREGQAARRRLDQAREDLGAALGRPSKDLVFTSGGTESDNLAVLGMARAAGTGHLVTSEIEHPAVLQACAALEREGFAVTRVRPNGAGLIEPDAVRAALRGDTVLVSIMHANNETGVVQPIAEIARVAREAGVPLHSDGVQAAFKIPGAGAADLYSVSGHKFGAPKGCGLLAMRGEVRPLLFGGRHERGRRAGTENVPGAAAMAAAARSSPDWSAIERLRGRLEAALLDRVPDASVNGAGAPRLPNTTNVRFDGIEGEAMVIALDLRGFAVSSGSACSSGAVEPSHVLIAMGLSREQAKSSVRFSLGAGNTAGDVDRLVDAVAASCEHLRRLSPVYA